MVSINVLIITYNQQDVIGRALESVLRQKKWGLKEVVICDDHSIDNNWAIIQTYVEKYPNVIRAYRNDTNLGIYGNWEKTYDLRGNADLYVNLSGDDIFNDGYFKKVQELVEKRDIDVKNEAAILCFDYMSIRPNGRKTVIRNKAVIRNISKERLKLRGFLNQRGMLMTNSIFERYTKVDLTKGVTYAENMCEIQGFSNADNAYYCPFVANIYYSRIGVSVSMTSTSGYKQRIAAWKELRNYGWVNVKDMYYCDANVFLNEYLVRPSFTTFYNFVRYYFKSIDCEIGISCHSLLLAFRDILFRTLIKK